MRSRPTPNPHPFGDATGVLAVGIGGGGDVVGAYQTTLLAQALGLHGRVGGVTWERRVVDVLPGPRRLDEIERAQRVNDAVALAGPDTQGPGGFRFAESHMAGFLGEAVVLVDPHGGPRAVGAALGDAAQQLGCDRIALVDVGGDVLGHGDEPGLASPLCDAILLASAAHCPVDCIAAVFGPGCDGELTPDEVLARIAEVAAAGGLLGASGITPDQADILERAIERVPTEASACAVRCARGEIGPFPIRGGRRSVPLSPLGAVTFYFDPLRAMASAARLAWAVRDAGSLEDAQAILSGLGVRTELDWEREAVQAPPP